ncbi:MULTISPECIES: molybdopterin-guanine dinucleotide biosynthesis protein B [Bacillus cereus group]|uniref:molybdopterin-guanine dinucleotide biosynthesis protein B n=1 Tax=Bacillus cereus group TaxID=86661 RepID=UPI000B42FFAF|nr:MULTISPECIES: molybdopterin-guanine dinucleotide biosynthesis protein B [Bacillus cereus group]MBH0348416.1 molybdopterin-guanine dinucleotide biosynthesis protein B [Bacillus thuringiensis]MDA1663679.1 molybdopterin-guanine dinucleotide biosynthesis protein B [Bacillus cereus group sp. TH153LC]MDA2167697.1 molybdopterin-guanine dinucleotide biosynthesis protein B [Bacillus cereus]MDQ7234026.1 molybdopterin-guanine dinucleotide biosynthesis protein B [Bacillus pacificus]MDQ7241056.1 molybdo
MGKAPSILQIVGYQNSGKTTLVEKIVHTLAERKMKVATIKHHGHGGFPEVAQKDSERHRKAGAVVSSVEGAGFLSLSSLRENWSLQEIIRLYEFFEVDTIVIEGYKKESYPKVVLLRSAEDVELLHKVENIIAVITWYDAPVNLREEYKVFHITEEELCIDWFLQTVRSAK